MSDTVNNQNEADGPLKLLIDIFEPVEPEVNRNKIKEYIPNLKTAIETLDEREQCVLKKRYFEGLTLKDTANLVVRVLGDNPCDGITRERVRQIQAKALRKLRHTSRRRIITGKISAKSYFIDSFLEPTALDKFLYIDLKKKYIELEKEHIELERKYIKLEKILLGDVDKIPVNEFADWSVRTQNCFKKGKIITIGDLLSTSKKDLLKIKNFGRKSFNEVRAAFNLI